MFHKYKKEPKNIYFNFRDFFGIPTLNLETNIKKKY